MMKMILIMLGMSLICLAAAPQDIPTVPVRYDDCFCAAPYEAGPLSANLTCWPAGQACEATPTCSGDACGTAVPGRCCAGEEDDWCDLTAGGGTLQLHRWECAVAACQPTGNYCSPKITSSTTGCANETVDTCVGTAGSSEACLICN